MNGVSFVLGSAPMRLKIPNGYDKLIVIAAAIADIKALPDETIIETHVLWQKDRREKIRGHKTKRLLVINGGYKNIPPVQFEDFIEYNKRIEISKYRRDKTIEQMVGHHIDATCGVFAICRELLAGNKVMANRISFTRRKDSIVYNILKDREDFTWLV